ncbi:MAG: hypothetical protein H8Z69_00200 [Nanohaloarchaea archaeon]|nr:hypothetical protein [Candidatus Nanohaloarchaea archaeon]
MDEKIMLDTNFLVAPFQLSMTLEDEFDRLYPFHQLYTLEDAVQEAKSIEGGKYGDLVETLIEKLDIEVLETEGEGTVDDLLLDVSSDYLVATNDKELKQRIRKEGNPVVIIRTNDHLEVVEGRTNRL